MHWIVLACLFLGFSGSCAAQQIPYKLKGHTSAIEPSQVGVRITLGEKKPNVVRTNTKAGYWIYQSQTVWDRVTTNLVLFEQADGYVLDMIIEDVCRRGSSGQEACVLESNGITTGYVGQFRAYVDSTGKAVIGEGTISSLVRDILRKNGVPKIDVESSLRKYEKMFEADALAMAGLLELRGKALMIGEKIRIYHMGRISNDALWNVALGFAIKESPFKVLKFGGHANCRLLVTGFSDDQVFLSASDENMCIRSDTRLQVAEEHTIIFSMECLVEVRLNRTYGIPDYKKEVCKLQMEYPTIYKGQIFLVSSHEEWNTFE